MGFTPLHYAVVARNKDTVKQLLDHGASAVLASKVSTCISSEVLSALYL